MCRQLRKPGHMYRKLTFPGNIPPFPLHKIFVFFGEGYNVKQEIFANLFFKEKQSACV